MAGKSASSETMPSLRALLANTTSCRSTCCWSSLGSKKTVRRRRNAKPTTGIGNCSITAPSVPPNTIIAAVGCRTCEILPPSSNRPATTPPTPTASPAKLLLSTVRLDCPQGRAGEAMRIGGFVAAEGKRTILDTVDDGTAELKDAVDHLPSSFKHHQLLTVQKLLGR